MVYSKKLLANMTLLLRSGVHYVALILQLYDSDGKKGVINNFYVVFGAMILAERKHVFSQTTYFNFYFLCCNKSTCFTSTIGS